MIQIRFNNRECWFEFIGGGLYSDYIIIAFIPFLLMIGQMFILYRFKPFISYLIDNKLDDINNGLPDGNGTIQERRSMLSQHDSSDSGIGAVEQSIQLSTQEINEPTNENKDIDWSEFTTNVQIGILACVCTTAATVIFMFSVDDPRSMWKENGWLQSMNGSVLMIICIAGGNDIFLLITYMIIKRVLHVSDVEPEGVYTVFETFQIVAVCCAILERIFFIVYYPYIVCHLMVFTGNGVLLSIIGLIGFGIFKICPCISMNCIHKCTLKYNVIWNVIVDTVALCLVYGIYLADITLILTITDIIGTSNNVFCIQEASRSSVAFTLQEIGVIIAVYSGMTQCWDKCVKH